MQPYSLDVQMHPPYRKAATHVLRPRRLLHRLSLVPSSHEAGLDAALIHSTIDAIPSPNSLLARMGGARGIVRERGGLVVVVSAYEWNEEVTPRGAWLGGYLDEAGDQVGHFLAHVW